MAWFNLVIILYLVTQVIHQVSFFKIVSRFWHNRRLADFLLTADMGVNATGTLGAGRRLSAEDARIEVP